MTTLDALYSAIAMFPNERFIITMELREDLFKCTFPTRRGLTPEPLVMIVNQTKPANRLRFPEWAWLQACCRELVAQVLAVVQERKAVSDTLRGHGHQPLSCSVGAKIYTPLLVGDEDNEVIVTVEVREAGHGRGTLIMLTGNGNDLFQACANYERVVSVMWRKDHSRNPYWLAHYLPRLLETYTEDHSLLPL